MTTWNPTILREQEIALVQNKMPEHLQRLKYSRSQIEKAQIEGLREIVAHAEQHSPWHKTRLDKININTLTLENIQQLPVMNKKELMTHWDEIVTDRDLTLKKASDFLDRLKPAHFEFYDEHYHIQTTGGSSGVMGIFSWSVPDFVEFTLPFFRYVFRDEFSTTSNPAVVAVLESENPIHMSTPVFSVPFVKNMNIHCIYANWPLEKIITHLNKLQPTHLIGYSSIIYRLAEKAAQGQLNITPKRISVNSEPLYSEMRDLIKEIWPVPLSNVWGSTDCGLHATNCDYSEDLHLTEDRALFEFVDENNQPVPSGTTCSKILVTLFYNKTLPLIRYQIDDQVTVLTQKCPCGSQYRLVKNVIGRFNDNFVYPNHVYIPMVVFQSALFTQKNITEFQIFQTEDGADILIITHNKDLNLESIEEKVRDSYEKAGFKNPKITAKIVDHLQRNAATGKLRQYVPYRFK